jgi:hypothetical protein
MLYDNLAVHPTFAEGLLTSVVEAGAAAPSVAATRVQRMPEVIARGGPPLLLPAEYPEEPARESYVANVVSDQTQAITARASAFVLSHYPWCQNPRFLSRFCADVVGAP